MHLELLRIEERRQLAVLADAEDLAFVARSGPERAVGVSDDAPEKWRRRFGQQRRRGPGEDAPVAVDRKVLDVPFQEVGLRRDGPERRRRCGDAGPRGKRERDRQADEARGTTAKSEHG